MDVSVEVKGLQEFEARLQEIGALGSQKVLRQVLRKIARPLFDRAKANAASVGVSGALYRSMGIQVRREKAGQVARVVVTSRARERSAVLLHNQFYKRSRKGVFYGWMLDQGHATKTSWARPKRWWTPAVASSEGEMVGAMQKEMQAALKRIEKRKSKQAAANP